MYCNLLKNIVNLGFDSSDNDLPELQYTPLPSQIYVIYVMVQPDDCAIIKSLNIKEMLST